MTEQQNPITPPPELVDQWATADGNIYLSVHNMSAFCQNIADVASSWGYEQRGAANEDELQKARDQELEACCEYLTKYAAWEPEKVQEMRNARKETLRKSKDCVEGYKITFCVKFNPVAHEVDDLRSPEDFGEYLANDVANLIINDFGCTQLDVSGFVVDVMTDKDKVEWKEFWESEE